ncbi:MAG: alpha/beta hydrolase [Eubacteriales bacterium]|nr:alpha/beta hydrolase [Eubacteriales bacterium]
MSVRIETVRTGGFSMNYFRFGGGAKTLVILPGLSVQSVMGAADAVEAAYRSLENEFTVYLFDRRNELPPSYSVRDMARDTAEAFQALGLKEVFLFGASQGGMIAQVIAIEHPELVSKMILGSSSSHVHDEQYRVIDNWVRLAKSGDRVGLYLSFGEELYPPALFEQYRETLIKTAATVTDEELARFVTLAEGIRGFDVTGELDRIRCPVLAIGDYADQVLDADATMEIAEKLEARPDFRFYLYAGYGHAAYDTAPGYLDRIRRFFEEESR